MNVRSILAVIFATILFGCSSTEEKKEVTVEDQGTSTGAGTQTYGAGEDTGTGVNPLNDPNSPLSVRIIYFEYDSSEIRPQYRQTIEAHAAYLKANPNAIMTLEGHADERGSREYNLALGERRALSVKNQMTLLGASAGQIRTISYGEERPAATGSNESAWSQNRRVEIIY